MSFSSAFSKILFLIVGLLLINVETLAQTGTIAGTVVNQKGTVITDVHVALESGEVAVTNGHGQFNFSGLNPKTYTLHVTHIGFRTIKKRVKVKKDAATQVRITMQSKNYAAPTLVVTATRTRRDIEEVPQPVTVIPNEQIESSGSMRLSDILAEQTGLTLTADHGTGVQVQGFTSDYTKILINGQPLIGRTAGTFNLDRITVGNVQQVEIVKGPSSALWGSDALAGVINIITQKGEQPFELDVNSRYGSNQTIDAGLNLSANMQGWKNNVFVNRNSSEGYRLASNAISQTVPSYHNYTTSYQTSVPISDAVEFEFQGRYYREEQSSTDYLGTPENPTLLDGNALQEDYSLAPSAHINLGSGFNAEINHYFSRYRTDTKYDYHRGDSLYDQSKFDQRFNKSDLQLNKYWNKQHITTLGSGYKHEQLVGERYPADPVFNSYFIYGQHEWMPSQKLDIITGFRYDGHSEYQSQLSPKISARYKFFDWLHVRASAGSGFKAPDFRQLFLDFTNPTVGYSVFGSSNAVERIQELQDRGQINQILIPLNQLQEIRAEQSWAYNAGVDLFPINELKIRLNVFRNDVSDLIESAPVASKTNGQSIFSYFNLNDVFTQGLETQLRWTPIDAVELSAGYQFLDARRKIEETRTVQDAEGEIIERSFSSYESMFNRSRHSANIKLFYRWEAQGLDANIRGDWRSRYGRGDSNANNIVDSGEYQDGYMIWDTAAAKTFRDRYTLQLGIDNMFDFTRPGVISYLPGRLYYAKLSLQLY